VIDRHRAENVFRREQTHVIPPSVSDSSSNPIKGERPITYKSRVGYLGRVGVEKGVDTLAEAAEALGLEVDIAGFVTDDDRVALRQISGRLNFLGEEPATKFLKFHEIVVVPSKWLEPFGRVVAEAAVAGVKVIIADSPGLVEAARYSGASYLTFRAGDSGSLRRALAKALDGTACWIEAAGDRNSGESMVDVVRGFLRDGSVAG
jgi:glycosyltransferase involved in cell wall biosynthesis